MKILKSIVLFPFYIIKWIFKGIISLSLFLSRGFYFYLVKFFSLLKKIFHFKWLDRVIRHFERRMEQPEYVLIMILWFVSFIALFNILYVDKDQEVHFEDNDNKPSDVVDNKTDPTPDENDSVINKDLNPYRIFGKYNINNINFSELKNINNNVVAWLTVDGTNINYPIVQTGDNDFYLNHSIDNSYKTTGWTFMDFRNDKDMTDSNTIFYGHNLLNKTAFGSTANIFTKNWINNSSHKIIVLTPSKKFTYLIFSAYYIDPEVYYLQTNFYSDVDYKNFLDTISGRNSIAIDNTVTIDDRIITLSTCTEDNKGRKAIHAKLIKEENR